MRAALAMMAKDLREARLALSLLVPLTLVLACLTVIGAGIQRVATSPLEPLRGVAIMMLSSTCLALSHAVVARELGGKTQLFLETLPARRSVLFAAKLVVFMLAVAAVTGAIFAGSFCTTPAAGVRAAVAIRLFSFAACEGSFFFLVGFLGRYRVPLVLLGGLGTAIVVSQKSIDLATVAPFVFLGQKFALENRPPPAHDLVVTGALSLACLVIAAVLALTREGDLPSRLSEKMSQKEKVFIALVAASLVILGAALDEKKPKDPYTLPRAAIAGGNGAYVAVGSGTAEGDQADRALADFLHDRIAAAHDVLGLKFARVIAVSSWDVPDGVVEEGSIDRADGVLFRTRPSQSPDVKERLLSRAVVRLASRATHGRGLREDRRFLVDGLGLLLSRSDHMSASLDADDDLLVRALLASTSPSDRPSAALPAHWLTFVDRAGVDGAEAMSFVGLRVLAHRCGDQKMKAFLRASIGVETPDDVRALFRTPDVDRVLLSTCGLTRAEWIASWQTEDEAARIRLAPQLAKLPRIDGALTFTKLGAHNEKAAVRLVDADALAPDFRVELETVRLGLDRDPLDEDDALREEHAADDFASGVSLPFTFVDGDRFAWRLVAVDAKAHVRAPSPWHREEARAP